MGLPIQQAPKFKCNLSDGTEVTYRPFLVKEQKYLLLAKESTDNEEILSAVKNLITAVTEGTVDAEKLAIFDLEYLFLNVRAKSVGETVRVNLLCRKKDCGGSGEAVVNLSEVEIIKDKEVDPKVMISDTVGVTLRYPNTTQLAKAESMKDEGDKLIKLLQYGIESIFDEESTYQADEIPDSDLEEFIENLTLDQLDKLNEFFETLPSIQKDVKFKCKTCGEENTSVLRGLQSFF